MAGDEQRHGLVAHLAIRHDGAVVVVAGPEQAREEIVAIGGRAAALVDHLLHLAVERRDGGEQTAPLGGGPWERPSGARQGRPRARNGCSEYGAGPAPEAAVDGHELRFEEYA